MAFELPLLLHLYKILKTISWSAALTYLDLDLLLLHCLVWILLQEFLFTVGLCPGKEH